MLIRSNRSKSKIITVLVLGTTLTFFLAQIRNQRFVYVCVRGLFGLPKNLLDISPPFELPILDYLGWYLGRPPSSKKLKILKKKIPEYFLWFLPWKWWGEIFWSCIHLHWSIHESIPSFSWACFQMYPRSISWCPCGSKYSGSPFNEFFKYYFEISYPNKQEAKIFLFE